MRMRLHHRVHKNDEERHHDDIHHYEIHHDYIPLFSKIIKVSWLIEGSEIRFKDETRRGRGDVTKKG